MVPPRPTLEWNDILDMATLADFNLLKDTNLDLTHVPWAQPGHRECVWLYFGLRRAREEIVRLNVEISRLLTFMIDKHADYYHAMVCARNKNTLDLASELEDRLNVSTEINGHIAIRLVQASELAGFSGTLVPGEQIGHDPSITDSAPLPAWASVVLGLTRNNDSYDTHGPSTDLSQLLPEPEAEDQTGVVDPHGLLYDTF
ncbi:hypothetical protein PM082_022188 [Marasmius tenuissimus]|nr:hypothetical protein PM082_022188 [Marasmius tenuissimus]